MKNKDPGDFTVGFGRPPKHTRFKKGQSGNPRGRPKGSKKLSAILSAALLKSTKVREGNRVKTMPYIVALLQVFLNKAAAGEIKTFMPLVHLALQLEAAGEFESPSKRSPEDEMSPSERLKMLLDQVHNRLKGHVSTSHPSTAPETDPLKR
jgi:hypothetical protein